ncbi:MAG: hypothetical protein ACOX7R_06225 [Acetivibrionales bacterium]
MKEIRKGVQPQELRFKGESVPNKDNLDIEPTGRYMKNNPYKTPPNKITAKDK